MRIFAPSVLFQATPLAPLSTAMTVGACNGGNGTTIVAGIGIGVISIGAGYLIHKLFARKPQDLLRPPWHPSAQVNEIELSAHPEPKTKLYPLSSTADLAELERRIRPTGPYSVQIDLRNYSSSFNFRIVRGPRSQYHQDGGEVVLALADDAVSQHHANLWAEYDLLTASWSLRIDDNSSNGTRLFGFGHVHQRQRVFKLHPDKQSIELAVGHTRIEFLLLNRPSRALPPASLSAPAQLISPEVQEAVASLKQSSSELNTNQVHRLVDGIVHSDRKVTVKQRASGVSAHIRSSKLTEMGELVIHYPHGMSKEAIRTTADFLIQHCHLFRPTGNPTFDIDIEWHPGLPQERIIILHGQTRNNTIAAGTADGVSGTLIQADIQNLGNMRPHASITLRQPTNDRNEIPNLLAQIEDAFRRIRRALLDTNASNTEIDNIRSVFNVRD